MLIEKEDITEIICDKCGKRSSSIKTTANNNFYNEGWVINPNGRKYKHICFDCQNKKQKKINLFIRKNF